MTTNLFVSIITQHLVFLA